MTAALTTRSSLSVADMVQLASATPEVVDLPDRVLEIARQDPHRIAQIRVGRTPWGNRRPDITTYATLSHRAEATAVGLRDLGVGKGSLCSFMVPPGEDAMVLALALWRVGAVMVGIEPHSHGMRSVARSLRRVGPEFFFGTPEAQLARKLFGWGRGTVHTSVTVGGPRVGGLPRLDDLERPWLGEPTPADVASSDPAVIAFTTGSTGDPKPTVMTHQNLAAMIRGVSNRWKLADAGPPVDMPTFPMFWIIGLAHGGTVIVPPMDFATKGPGQADPAKLVRTISDHDVSSMFGSPALLANLAGHCERERITLPSVRRIVAGGAEVQGPLFAAVKRVIVNGEMYSDYGATEALPIAEIDGTTVLGETWERTERGEGVCVGTPLAGVEVRIIEVADAPVATIDDARRLGAGTIGEVIARSPHISDHYYGAPDDMVENKIVDGATRWHRLGDTGWLDEQGRLWVCGRRSHRVGTADRTYFPLCCEPVFNAHPDVARTALVGVPGPVGAPAGGSASRPVIVVELTAAARARAPQVVDQLRSIAASHDSTEGIDTFAVIDVLPVDRRHNAKIDRPALAREVAAGTLAITATGSGVR